MENLSKHKILNVINDKKNILLSTHSRLSLPIINRIYKKMMNEIKFDDIKVCEDLIIDGHHRYICSLCANVEIGKVKYSKTSATNQDDWFHVDFVDEEWDTLDKIKRLNAIDAKYNNVTIEEVTKMIE